LGVTVAAVQSDTLIDDQAPAKAVKAERVIMLPEMSVAEAFTVIVSACINHFRSNEQLVVGERDPAALHQSRIALRRLRSAFSLFRDAVDGAEFDRLRDELRWLTRRLGTARDFDMIFEHEVTDEQWARLEPEREHAYDRAIEGMNSSRCRLLLADLLDWQAHGDWRSRRIARKRVGPFAKRRLDRLWSKTAHSKRVSRMTKRQRHRLRKRTKTLRYSLRFVAALHADVRKRRKKFFGGMKDLQQALGELNDLAIARNFIAFVPSPAVERGLIGEAEQAIERLRKIGPYWRHAER
jgi:CHAD domain-containing protein